MKDKDNITDFTEVKKRLQTKDNQEKDMTDLLKNHNFSTLLEEIGISSENEMLKEMLNHPDIDSMIESVQQGRFSYEDMTSLLEGFKNLEAKFKQEKKTYRAFGQWVSYHKPYDLSTLYPMEQIRQIADELSIPYEKMNSKNDIIDKIKPYLEKYISDLLISLDEEMMSYFGKVIYSDGKLLIENILSENDENQIDFLQRKSILSRINENGKHYLIIPAEFQQIVTRIDFNNITKYNRLNSLINQTVIAFANSYGVYPKSLLEERIQEQNQNFLNSFENLDFTLYLQKQLKTFFSSGYSLSPMYPSVIVSDDYVHHGVVEFTKYLIDIQNENITDYKILTPNQIKERGHILYSDDSIYQKQILQIIEQYNELDFDEPDQIKNLIYIFSYLEFEPDLIVQMLGMRYTLPPEKEYEKMMDVLRAYYKNSEKWILKGYTSFEANNKTSDFDASKIIKFDFINK